MAGDDGEPAAPAAAAAALDAIWRPVTNLDVDELATHQATIVDAAVRALGAALP